MESNNNLILQDISNMQNDINVSSSKIINEEQMKLNTTQNIPHVANNNSDNKKNINLSDNENNNDHKTNINTNSKTINNSNSLLKAFEERIKHLEVNKLNFLQYIFKDISIDIKIDL